MKMKLLIAVALVGLLCMGSNADFADFSAPQGWMNVGWVDDPVHGNELAFGSFWGVADLRALTTDDRTFVLLPNINTYADAVAAATTTAEKLAYWTNSDDGGLTAGPDGNKRMQAVTYYERAPLAGSETAGAFSFDVSAFDLDPRYQLKAFVKVLDPGSNWNPHGPVYEVAINNTGPFTLKIPMDASMADMHLQVGWAMEGLNANPAGDWGSVTVTTTALTIPEPSSIAMIGLVSGCAVFIRRRFMI
jgi:hypothetical protein